MASRKGKPNITPAQEREYLELVSVGMYPEQAALKIGFTGQAFTNKKRKKEFKAEFSKAEALAEFRLFSRVLKDADARTLLEVMARRWPQRWARPEIRAEMNVSVAPANTVELWKLAAQSLPLDDFADGALPQKVDAAPPSEEPAP